MVCTGAAQFSGLRNLCQDRSSERDTDRRDGTRTMTHTNVVQPLAAVTRRGVVRASHAQTPATGPAYPTKADPPRRRLSARRLERHRRAASSRRSSTQLLGAQVVVENRPGANATIATDFVAKSPPDGYTIMLGSASPLVISPFTYPNIPYDTLRDFAAITTVASTPELMAIHPSLPARNLKELVALAKSQPGKLNFASSGNGGLPHLAIELFKKLGKVNVVHVPYKGAGPAVDRPDRRSRARDDHRHARARSAREKREAARHRDHGGEAQRRCCRTCRRRPSRACRA